MGMSRQAFGAEFGEEFRAEFGAGNQEYDKDRRERREYGGKCRACGVIIEPVSTIYQYPSPETTDPEGRIISAIADEGLCGMLVEITGEQEQGFLPIKTFYGYTGYISPRDIAPLGSQQGWEWENADLWVVDGFCVDVVSLPMVQGLRLISLFRGSILEVLNWESSETGWAKVRLPDKREGYIRNQYLRKKLFSQRGALGGVLSQIEIADEGQFRQDLVETARSFLGVQYRWGGRSTAGIDCSGLTSASYLLNGILIFRDARLREGYPVHEIDPKNKKPGDLLYFPGHIAMYLGDEMYIHSTGKIGSGGVVINSLCPESPLYRQDLADRLYAVGSVFS